MRTIKKVVLSSGQLFGGNIAAIEWQDGTMHGITQGRMDIPAIQELLTEARSENAPIIDDRGDHHTKGELKCRNVN